jgi:hypothetical protein
MAQTPPCHLPNIPGVTSPGTLIEDSKVEVNNLNNMNNHDRKHAVGKGMPVLGAKNVALGNRMSVFCCRLKKYISGTTDREHTHTPPEGQM